jgi:hypothetical protein
MFLATMGPLSGETTVFMRHLVLVVLCGYLSGMQGGFTTEVTITVDEVFPKYLPFYYYMILSVFIILFTGILP